MISLTADVELETVVCAVCGSATAMPLHENGDLMHGLPGRFTLVKCRGCGLVYLNPRPTRQGIACYYPDDYVAYERREGGGRLRKLDTFLSLRKRCGAVLRHKTSGALVDVGCGTGHFLRGMREYLGWKVSGVEPNAPAAAYCSDCLGLDAFAGDLAAAAYNAESVDVITFWDVLEHLHDPLETLRECRRILVDDGLLLITVPNLGSPESRLFGRSWAGLDSPRHLYVFSRKTITRLLRQAGFDVVEVRCLTGRHQSFMVSLQFLAAAHPGAAAKICQLVFQVISSPVSRLLAFPFFYMLDALKLGSKITVAARKRTITRMEV
ncbi:MAG: class I SAM-dependent methyltransferase [Chloroflexi bacterium]|nr:class I SAM-dependent methyltransferase [Chloroflexota bacterium]